MTSSPGIVFVKRKEKAKRLAEEIGKQLGHAVPWVTSEVSQKQRDEYIEKMKDGSIKVAVATSAWSTGIDIPELLWVAYADTGRAPIWVIQSAGRASRVADGKDGFDVYDLSCQDTRERRGHLDGYVSDEEMLTSMLTDVRFKVRNGRRERQQVVEAPSRVGWLLPLIFALALYITCNYG